MDSDNRPDLVDPALGRRTLERQQEPVVGQAQGRSDPLALVAQQGLGDRAQNTRMTLELT